MHRNQVGVFLFFIGLAALMAFFAHSETKRQTQELREQSIERCEASNKNIEIANNRSKALEEVSASIISLTTAVSKTSTNPKIRTQAAVSTKRLVAITPALTKTYPMNDCDLIFKEG
jgi:hypothetical protein